MSSVTEQIKERLDIVNYIQQVVPSLKKAGRTYKACCPFHGEKSPSFVVNPDSQTWRCYGACAEGGDLFNFVMKYKGLSFADALKELAEQTGVQLKPKSPQAKQEDEKLEQLRGMLQTAAEYYHQHLRSEDSASQAALQYTREKRGFTDSTIDAFLIGYAPEGWSAMLEALKKLGHTEDEMLAAGLASKNERGNVYDRFRNRLMIPIRDERGRVIGFGARALNPDDSPKYLNSPQSALFDKSRTLFGLDTAKRAIQDSETAVIVEGYMDAIQAHQAGYTNVIAQMGTALTESQLRLIVPRYAKKIILALDADAAGQKATRRSLEVARETLNASYKHRLPVDIKILTILEGKDPDDLLRENPLSWENAVNNAVAVEDFIIDAEIEGVEIQRATILEKQEIASRLLPILDATQLKDFRERDASGKLNLTGVKNDFLTQANLQKLALKLKLPEKEFLDWVVEWRRQQRPSSRKTRPTEPPAPAVKSIPEPPPLPNEMYVGSSDEPPPYFPSDDDMPPTGYEDYDMVPDLELRPVQRPAANAKLAAAPAAARLPGFQMRHANRAAELEYLRFLLNNPDIIYSVNRGLREITEEVPNAALRDLSTDDFSQIEYGIIFKLFLQAINQHEMDTLDYIQTHCDDVLREDLEKLLLDEPSYSFAFVNQRYKGEMHTIVQNYQKQNSFSKDTTEHSVTRALTMRLGKIHREFQEMQLIMRENLESGDQEAIEQLLKRVMEHQSAKARLERVIETRTKR